MRNMTHVSSMWVPIFLQNRNHVLDVLKEHIEQLMQFRQQLETADAEGLRKLMEKANGIRRILRVAPGNGRGIAKFGHSFLGSSG